MGHVLHNSDCTLCDSILMLCSDARKGDALQVFFNIAFKSFTAEDSVVSAEFLDNDTL